MFRYFCNPMERFKSFTALLLLLTYTVGCAHGLIPHCDLAEDVHASKHHHEHVTLQNMDDDDVLHAGHLDDSLVDFVFCVIEDLGHHQDANVHVCMDEVTDLKTNTSSFKKMKLAAVAHVLFSIQTDETPVTIGSTPCNEHPQRMAYVANLPQRGPPSIS